MLAANPEIGFQVDSGFNKRTFGFKTAVGSKEQDPARVLDAKNEGAVIGEAPAGRAFSGNVGAGQAAENRARLDGFVSLVETVAGLDRLTGRTPPADHEARTARQSQGSVTSATGPFLPIRPCRNSPKCPATRAECHRAPTRNP